MFMDETFVFDVLWDNEAGVWYTYGTPVQGAMAEAPTLDELYSKLSVIVSEMLQMNNKDHGRSKLPIMVKAFKETVLETV